MTAAAAVSAPAPAAAAPTIPPTIPPTATTLITTADTTTTDTTTVTTTTDPSTATSDSPAPGSPTSGSPTEPAPAVVERTDPPRHPIPPPRPEATYLVGDSITDMNRAVIAPVLDECGADVHLHSLSARRIEQGYEWNEGWVNSGLDEIGRILEADDPTTWVIELGSNDLQDIATPQQAHRLIREVLDRTDDDDRVLWTTVLWPHYASATEIFNAALFATPGIELVEWHAVGGGHLADPVHPTDEGARILASMYCDALAA